MLLEVAIFDVNVSKETASKEKFWKILVQLLHINTDKPHTSVFVLHSALFAPFLRFQPF